MTEQKEMIWGSCNEAVLYVTVNMRFNLQLGVVKRFKASVGLVVSQWENPVAKDIINMIVFLFPIDSVLPSKQ